MGMCNLLSAHPGHDVFRCGFAWMYSRSDAILADEVDRRWTLELPCVHGVLADHVGLLSGWQTAERRRGAGI